MNSAPIHRWGLGFMAKRWWRLLIALPLLALIAGGCFEWFRYQRSHEARCIVQVPVDPVSLPSPVPGAVSSPLPEAREIILSDLVLEDACTDSGFFPKQESDVASKLRRLIRCEPIPGTSLLVISVEGRMTSRTVELCNAVVDRAARKVQELHDEARTAELNRRQEEIQALQERMIEKREHFLQFVKFVPAGTPSNFQPTADFLTAKQEFEAAAKAHDMAKEELVSVTAAFYGQAVSRMIIHERAALPLVTSPLTLVKPLVFTSLWVSVAMLLAVILAYLLEALFPKPLQPRA